MKDLKGRIGYIIGGISILWILFNCIISLRDISTALMFIIGSSIQPVILLLVGLLSLKFSNLPNFMNEPENTKKWVIITFLSFYIFIFCSIFSLFNVYYIPLGRPRIIYSLAYFLIGASVITFLIYFKKTMNNKLLRWSVTLFSILFFCYGSFLTFVFIFALPDKSSRPGLGAIVIANSVAIMIFQLIRFKKKYKLKQPGCDNEVGTELIY